MPVHGKPTKHMSIEAITRGFVDVVRRRALAPDPQVTVSEWADAHRMLPATAAEPGRWRTSRTPYLAEIMDALSVSSPIERVVFMKSAQVGGACRKLWRRAQD